MISVKMCLAGVFRLKALYAWLVASAGVIKIPRPLEVA